MISILTINTPIIFSVWDVSIVSVKYEYEKTSHASVKAWLVFQNQIFIYVERQ